MYLSAEVTAHYDILVHTVSRLTALDTSPRVDEFFYGVGMQERTFTLDEEFQKRLRPLSPQEKSLLEKNIVKSGRALDRLVVWNGLLVDGHHRLEACEANELPYNVRQLDCDSRDEVLQWIDENQEGRRNDPPSVRALRVAENTTFLGHGEKKNQRATSSSLAEAAEKADVSVATMKHAKKVKEKGSPAIMKAINEEKMTVKEAASVVDKPKPEQMKAAKEPKKPDVANMVNPWDGLNASIEEQMTVLRGVSRKLNEIFDFEPQTKRARAKWAYYYHKSVVENINMVVRELGSQQAAEACAKHPGYIRVWDVQLREKK